MIRRLRTAWALLGGMGLLGALVRRVRRPRLACHAQCRALVAEKVGIEIGGPSTVFARGGWLPLYPYVGRLDNCNFARRTVWQGEAGEVYRYDTGRAPGRQHVAEAADLGFLADGTFDFLLSSHVLEHTANPLKALSEWMRVLKEEGVMVLVVPHGNATFDRHREVTILEHLVRDWEGGVEESDLTHAAEVLQHHDRDRDPGARDEATFAARVRQNLENRCLHHHVFDTRLVVEVVDHAGLQLLAVEAVRPFHVFAVARKLLGAAKPQNAAFLDPTASHFAGSPFPSDRTRSGNERPGPISWDRVGGNGFPRR